MTHGFALVVPNVHQHVKFGNPKCTMQRSANKSYSKLFGLRCSMDCSAGQTQGCSLGIDLHIVWRRVHRQKTH
eukprot:989500-Amphidinium_carterae.1